LGKLALCAFSEASRKFEIGQKVRKKAKEKPFMFKLNYIFYGCGLSIAAWPVLKQFELKKLRVS